MLFIEDIDCMLKLNLIKMKHNFIYLIFAFVFTSCNQYFKNDYDDNSPTSGKLKVYYDEGLTSHVKELTTLFEANYTNAKIQLKACNDDEAIQALLNDSCKAIIVSRPLSLIEEKNFKAKKWMPDNSVVALNGLGILVNYSFPIKSLSTNQIYKLLSEENVLTDSTGNNITVNVVFDKNNSSVLHYLKDSILKTKKFAKHCNTLTNAIEAIDYVSKNKSSIAFIDYASFSDVDDTLNKFYNSKVKFIAIKKNNNDTAFLPNQSSFLLNQYPFIRKIYVYKTASEFSLAKGFQTFIAGPKGQHVFLKGGLMPTKQQERSITVKLN